MDHQQAHKASIALDHLRLCIATEAPFSETLAAAIALVEVSTDNNEHEVTGLVRSFSFFCERAAGKGIGLDNITKALAVSLGQWFRLVYHGPDHEAELAMYFEIIKEVSLGGPDHA